jgi:hypothetical protein
MAVLIIGATERERIAEIIAIARTDPMPVDRVMDGAVLDSTDMIRLRDRKPGFERPPTQQVYFPGGYRAAFSFEHQPAGLCSHLSIGVDGRAKKGTLPSMEVIQAIAALFGVPCPPDRGWLEEYQPGEYAVNLVSRWEGGA